MNNINLSALKDNDIQYESFVSSLSDSYRGEWDDEVHESYELFLKQMKDSSNEVRKIRCKMETIEKEIDALNIAGLNSKTDRLCREANAV